MFYTKPYSNLAVYFYCNSTNIRRNNFFSNTIYREEKTCISRAAIISLIFRRN